MSADEPEDKATRKRRRPTRPRWEPITEEEQAAFAGYVRTKAKNMAELGVDGYREQDALRRPPADWDQDDLDAVYRGCQQIADGRGLDRDNPMEEIGIPGCYALIHTLHFKAVGQQATFRGDDILDEMRCVHSVTGSFPGALFNLVVPEPWPEDDE